ncbi:MAG: cobyric acid synthase [Verrucomicrobiota bacterium]
MKAISVLGTSSNAGKSWMATAFCSLLRRKGYKVAPFKAQNMSNNSWVTLGGGEIGRAQGVQAEACGLLPDVMMNPLLLKPSGPKGSQLIVNGKAEGHFTSREYYEEISRLWQKVLEALEHWKNQCDVLVLEGAGSPVELNLMDRDLVNLKPIEYLDGRWLLVADIERGGVFAQIAGTWALMSEAHQQRSLGYIVNKFRGDLSLFEGADVYLKDHVQGPYLGVLPYRNDLPIESEDSLCAHAETQGNKEEAFFAWVRFPRISNSQDIQPWMNDSGVEQRWVTTPSELEKAKALILPGSKNTLSDLAWLRNSGLDEAIKRQAAQGVPIVGICGGYQMLGRSIVDVMGHGGEQGQYDGLNLLPLRTEFAECKTVNVIQAGYKNEQWEAYEIHMGQTTHEGKLPALLKIKDGNQWIEEGVCEKNIWGTYLHGLFESPLVRGELARLAGLENFTVAKETWRSRQEKIYQHMADCLEEHLNLNALYAYVEH